MDYLYCTQPSTGFKIENFGYNEEDYLVIGVDVRATILFCMNRTLSPLFIRTHPTSRSWREIIDSRLPRNTMLMTWRQSFCI